MILKIRKLRMTSLHKLEFSVTRGAPVLYSAPEIEDEALSFYFLSKSDAALFGSLGTSGSQAFYQTRIFGL